MNSEGGNTTQILAKLLIGEFQPKKYLARRSKFELHCSLNKQKLISPVYAQI